MWTYRVVEGLQIGEYVCLGAGPCGVVVEMDQLALEAAEEIFCHGVVVRIALAGHALPDSIALQPSLEGSRGVLDTPVAMKDEPLGRVATADRHVQGFQSQGSVDALRKGIAHDFSGT